MALDEKAQAYIHWNEALLKKFFPEDVEDNVRILVTSELLDEIGEKYGLGDHKSFMEIVCVPKEERRVIYHAIRSQLKLSTDRRRSSENIWKDAIEFYVNGLSDSGCKKELYFNYIVLLMYIAHDYIIKNESDASLGDFIRQYIKNSIGENSYYDLVETLFTRLAKDHPEFKNLALTKQRYIGLIRYQLGLTDGQISKLERALYNCGEQYDDMTFNEQRNILKVYIDDDNLLKQLNDNSLEDIFSELIENFDPEEYASRSYEDDGVGVSREMRKGEVALAIDQQDKFLLLTKTSDRDIKIIEGDTTFYIYSCRDTYGDYNSNPVRIESNGENQDICFKEYRFRGYRPLTFINEGIIFFQELPYSPYLVQTRTLKPQLYTIALIKRLQRGDTDRFVRKWKDSSCYAENGFVQNENANKWAKKMFGEEWICYETKTKEQCPQYFFELTSSPKNEKLQYGFAGGIPLGRKGYLSTALPYLKLPSPIDPSLLTQCELLLNGEKLTEKDYSLIWHNDKLIIDLLKNNANKHSLPLSIYITYDRAIYPKHLLVKWPSIDYTPTFLQACDPWGQINEGKISPFLQGNTLVSKEKEKITTNYNITPQDRPKSLSSYRNNFYFIALLTACCISDPNYMITHNKMEKCIRYACSRHNLSIPDQDTTSSLINKLSAAGYINIIYTKARVKYQLIPPTFVEVPQNVGRGHMLALIGSYTFSFLDNIEAFCKERNLFISFESSLGKEDIDQLLPPIVMIENRFKKFKDDFYQEYGSRLEIISGIDYPLSMANFANGLKQYKSEFNDAIEVDEHYLKPSNNDRYPRVRILANTIIPDNTQYLQSDVSTFYEPRIRDYSYLWLYAAYLRKEQLIRIAQKDAKIIMAFKYQSLPYLLERSVFLMGFKHLREGKIFVLDSANKECPLFEKAFLSEIYDDRQNLPRTCELYSKLYPDYRGVLKKTLKSRMKLYRLTKNPWWNKRQLDMDYILECAIENISIWATKKKIWLKYNDYNACYIWDEKTGTVNSVLSALLTGTYNQFKDLGFVSCEGNRYINVDMSVYEEDPDEITIVNESEKK